nr:CMRF35-like molecule 5 [Vicugna pacos]
MGGRTTWLLPALLLLFYPGSAAITGPKAVRGLERGSLTVQCRYGPGWEPYVKWWCRGADWGSFKFVVKTTGSEKEVKKDRVSIKDNQKNRSFTVTMEKLRLNDADTYWCGIERFGTDLGVPVKVTVDPAPVTTGDTRGHPSDGSRSLLGSVHFLLLVFLKVPLLLGMLGAVLWVNRPQRSSVRRQS